MSDSQSTSLAVSERIRKIIAFISEGLKEKDEAVRLSLLAAIAGESIFLLGPPGTAKSMVSRRLKCAFKGADGKLVSYFEYLMNQFSTPDELFGPVSLKKLEGDVYERITGGYLPDAVVAFLDEIWKASPAIQNTLLTIINEKKFHNGSHVIDPVPLKVLISASNELPAENQGLKALWDRFLLRLMVNPIEDEKTFLQLVCGKPVKSEVMPSEEMTELLLSEKELDEWKIAIQDISVPEEVQEVLAALRSKLRELHNEKPEKSLYYISDRRWTKIVNLLRTSAFLNGRTTVDLMDCSLISYCIWNSDDLIDEMKRLVDDSIVEDGHGFADSVDEIRKQIKSLDDFVTQNFFVDSDFEPQKFKMKDGTMAYKIVKPQEIYSYQNCRPYYISPNYKHRSYNRTGAYFDDKGNLIGDYDYYIEDSSFEINGDTITWTDGCRANNGYYGNRDATYSAKIVTKPTKRNKKSPELYGYYASGTAKVYTMTNGSKAYRILNPQEIYSYDTCKPYYISPNYTHQSYNRKGAYFDYQGDLIGDYYIKDGSFNANGDTITWIDGCRGSKYTVKVDMNLDKFIKGDKNKLNMLTNQANGQYNNALSRIHSELSAIKEYIFKKESQYKSNLFADLSFCDVIMTEAKRAKSDLELAEEELEKVKFRYENLQQRFKFSLKRTFLIEKQKCEVKFSVSGTDSSGIKSVSLAGDFNDWNVNKNPLKRNADGSFSCTLELQLYKRYEFKYFIDSEWVTPENADDYKWDGVSTEKNAIVDTSIK